MGLDGGDINHILTNFQSWGQLLQLSPSLEMEWRGLGCKYIYKKAMVWGNEQIGENPKNRRGIIVWGISGRRHCSQEKAKLVKENKKGADSPLLPRTNYQASKQASR